MPPILTVERVVVGVEGNRIGFCCQLTDESVTLVLLPKGLNGPGGPTIKARNPTTISQPNSHLLTRI